MLDLAARLGARGFGRVEPNPVVGAVIARDGLVLGMGHHRVFGGAHAEVEAIEACRRAGADVRGATLYCTLEPCHGTGKQGSCCEAIKGAGLARVVYARPDPHPKGREGAATLRQAGIACDLSYASPSATRLSDPFVKRVTTGLPWVIAKWAQTIDGRIATRTGESQWISNPHSRRRVHELRGRVDAILTGIGTVLADDPLLTAREVPVRRAARRVIVDTHLDLPPGSKLARTARQAPTTLACDKAMAVAHIALERRTALEDLGVEVMGVPTRLDDRVDLELLLRTLVSHHGVSTVLVESGAALLGSLLASDLVDELRVYVAPMLLADDHARPAMMGLAVPSLGEARRFTLIRAKAVGEDVELRYRASRA